MNDRKKHRTFFLLPDSEAREIPAMVIKFRHFALPKYIRIRQIVSLIKALKVWEQIHTEVKQLCESPNFNSSPTMMLPTKAETFVKITQAIRPAEHLYYETG